MSTGLFPYRYSFSVLAGECSACVYNQLHPPSCRPALGLQLELSGRPSGARLPASALLSGLAQCGAALSSELLCTSNLTTAPVWATS